MSSRSGRGKAARKLSSNAAAYVDSPDEESKPKLSPLVLQTPTSTVGSTTIDSAQSTPVVPASPSTSSSVDFAPENGGAGGVYRSDTMPYVASCNGQASSGYWVPMPVPMSNGMQMPQQMMSPMGQQVGQQIYQQNMSPMGQQMGGGSYSGWFGDVAPSSAQGMMQMPNNACYQAAAPAPHQPVQNQSRQDNGAQSLAARLAQEFPSARIIIGAPDSQEAAPPKVEAQNDLDTKMRRLQELLKQGRPVKH